MINGLFDAQAWEEAWKEDPSSFVNRTRSAGIDMTRSFDSKAESFNKEVFSEEGQKRSERIIGWIEGQDIDLKGLRILDVGAASGGFSVPFARRGAHVTALEPNGPLAELLRRNAEELNREETRIEIVTEPFEEIDIRLQGWEQAFDLVFVSMCPAAADWESVERILSCSRQFVYISLSAGGWEHSLLKGMMPQLGRSQEDNGIDSPDMGYLLHLLYLKGYAYESIVTREMKTKELTPAAAVNEAMALLRHGRGGADGNERRIIEDYVAEHFGEGPVPVSQGGRFGKVLIRLQNQSMYSRSRSK